MSQLINLPLSNWDQPIPASDQELAVAALERGDVLLFPHLAFDLQPGEEALLSPAVAGKGKNLSLDRRSGVLRGSSLEGAELQRLQAMVLRFAVSTRTLMSRLFPRYEARLQQARTSFRPVEIARRPVSWRKDDTRLHVDSFPSSPTQGQRILRVFTNIHPGGQRRQWRLGEPFEDVARRFLPAAPAPVPGSARAMQWLHITKRRRSPYDHYMLQLHDRMKADLAYQAQVRQREVAFAPGSVWMVYTDQASHAAMSGQHALEQTFHLPVESMQDPTASPLRVLERLLGRPLT